MNIFQKIFSFFKKTKETIAKVDLEIQVFINKNKKQIKLLMTILEAIFPANTGAKKMACVVANVCTAIGFETISKDVSDIVEAECQKIYNEFKASLN